MAVCTYKCSVILLRFLFLHMWEQGFYDDFLSFIFFPCYIWILLSTEWVAYIFQCRTTNLFLDFFSKQNRKELLNVLFYVSCQDPLLYQMNGQVPQCPSCWCEKKAVMYASNGRCLARKYWKVFLIPMRHNHNIQKKNIEAYKQ